MNKIRDVILLIFLVSLVNSKLTESWYFIVAKVSGKCMDNAGQSDGGQIHQYDCHGKSNQRWRIIPNDDGTVTLKNLADGRIMETGGPYNSNGAKTQMYTDYSLPQQKYWLEQFPTGHFRLKNTASNRCLDVPAGSQSNSVQMQFWDCDNNNDNQKFTFILAEMR
jgi:endo-1,4-beta-xylanase